MCIFRMYHMYIIYIFISNCKKGKSCMNLKKIDISPFCVLEEKPAFVPCLSYIDPHVRSLVVLGWALLWIILGELKKSHPLLRLISCPLLEIISGEPKKLLAPPDLWPRWLHSTSPPLFHIRAWSSSPFFHCNHYGTYAPTTRHHTPFACSQLVMMMAP